MGKIPPAPSPCSSWLHHLGVTSRKDQPLGKTTTRTGHDGSANTSHTHTHTRARGRESRQDALTGAALAVTGVGCHTLCKEPETPLQKGHRQQALGCHPAH